MSLVVMSIGSNALLNSLTGAMGGTQISGCKMRLYTNNHTPTVADVLGDFTEATFAGYAAVTMTGWSVAAFSSPRSGSTAGTVTFTRTTTGTTQNIYGYYVTDTFGTLLMWAELDPSAPVPITNAGDSYAVIPKFTLRSEF